MEMKWTAQVERAIDTLLEESEKSPLLAAIDGKCGSGKTTMGEYLRKRYSANLFHMDDFFLRPEQRTGERLAEVGGNVDYERFKEEVLDRVCAGKTVYYRKYHCSTGELSETVQEIPAKRLNIIEGSYSLHPYFGNRYDLKIFMDIEEKEQIENLKRRGGTIKNFVELWIPKENEYFRTFEIEKDCMKIPFCREERKTN